MDASALVCAAGMIEEVGRMLQIRRAIYFQIGGLLLGLAVVLVAGQLFPVADWLAAAQQKVVQQGSWSAIWYVVLYACSNILLLPGGVLSMGGGFFFGLWWGFLIVFVGNVTAAAVAFLLGRRFGRRWLRSKLLRSRTLDRLGPAVEREGWKIVLLSQLHPLFPTSLLNYVYGLTAIRFRTCILWVAIGQAPGLFLYSYLGTLGQLSLNLLIGKTHPRLVEYVFWGGGLVLSIAVLVLVGRIAVRLMKEAQYPAGPREDRMAQPVQRERAVASELWLADQ
jgi:uncharacterized membrane protein YdjX (TVP38/TMEM64 family)